MNIGLFVGGNNKKSKNYLANMGSQKRLFFQTNLLWHFDDKPLILLGFDGFARITLSSRKGPVYQNYSFLKISVYLSKFC